MRSSAVESRSRLNIPDAKSLRKVQSEPGSTDLGQMRHLAASFEQAKSHKSQVSGAQAPCAFRAIAVSLVDERGTGDVCLTNGDALLTLPDESFLNVSPRRP
jgi:hypothetical protein